MFTRELPKGHLHSPQTLYVLSSCNDPSVAFSLAGTSLRVGGSSVPRQLTLQAVRFNRNFFPLVSDVCIHSSQRSVHRACTSENWSAPSSQTALQMTFLGPPHATPPRWEASDARSGESAANLSSCCCLLCKACFLKQEMLRGRSAPSERMSASLLRAGVARRSLRPPPHLRRAGADTFPLVPHASLVRRPDWTFLEPDQSLLQN